MTASESWVKSLKCPQCGQEGLARLAQTDDRFNPYGFRTIVEHCPNGFRVQEDEDDSYIMRFFCLSDDSAADQ